MVHDGLYDQSFLDDCRHADHVIPSTRQRGGDPDSEFVLAANFAAFHQLVQYAVTDITLDHPLASMPRHMNIAAETSAVHRESLPGAVQPRFDLLRLARNGGIPEALEHANEGGRSLGGVVEDQVLEVLVVTHPCALVAPTICVADGM